MRSEIATQIRAYLDTIPVIDTHEHLPPFERDWKPSDILSEYLVQYAGCDLISAGLPAQTLWQDIVRNTEHTVAEKWAILEPYWQYARSTAYWRALDTSVRMLYGVDGINGQTIVTLNDRFMEAAASGNRFRTVLKDTCHIETSILDCYAPECDPELYHMAINVAPLMFWQNQDDLKAAGKLIGEKLDHFVDYLDAVERYLIKLLDGGAVCLKCALAYYRPLRFENASRSDAKLQFRAMIRHEPDAFTGSNAFQDFMLHFLLGILERRGGVIQFHTGLQEGNGNHIENSDPTLLTELFSMYPHVSFDLFHISYPFQGKAAVLAKNFPNVYLDMCWAHIISPSACRAALDNFLDAVPHNKLFAFGGDYCLVDGVAGHLAMAKDNVAEVLAARVERGDCTEEDARKIAWRLFYQNAKELYKIS